jgi:hypothetical protein
VLLPLLQWPLPVAAAGLVLLLLLGVGLPGGAGSAVLLAASYPLVGKAAAVGHHMVAAKTNRRASGNNKQFVRIRAGHLAHFSSDRVFGR